MVPTLICCGKALGGGLPIAAVLGPAPVMAAWDGTGEARHTATFVAHPLACAAAVATLELLEKENVVDHVRSLSAVVGASMESIGSVSPFLEDFRGVGMLWGLEWRSAREAALFARSCLERGVLVLAGGPEGRVAQLAPPLTIARPQLEYALRAVRDAAASVA
ncbi:MAG: aminotransferase class III-fold pyridoxal phosphate-dependent enzyme [Thermoanaerobaculia bacterium]